MTSGSRWSKGKANINSYDCWLYSETFCNDLACFLCGLLSSQNYVLHAEQFNSSATLAFSKANQLWIHRSTILNPASSLPSLSSVSLLCQLGINCLCCCTEQFECECVVVKAKIMMSAEIPLLSTGHQVILTKKQPKQLKTHKKST